MDTTQHKSSERPLPHWARAHGEPLHSVVLRATPADFQVTEVLGWACSGDGEHDYLFIEKIGANTEWVARQLAEYAEVPVRDVGYSGLKDRHAITSQWFSVPRWHSPDWQGFVADGVAIVEVNRHLRKLRRGAHRANQFRIVLRSESQLESSAWLQRINEIRQHGVPNYFGEQRFGRGGGNLRLANDWAAGKRLSRDKRSMAISTIRSLLFNDILSQRVHEKTWNQFVAGDIANLDGSASVFEISEINAELQRRCAEMDIHPAGILAGDGSGLGPEKWQNALAKARVEQGTRSFRLAVRDLVSEDIEGGIVLRFSLGRGAYATSVLRELCEWPS